MTSELLQILPPHLSFTFELKKQSSCSVQLGNNSDQYVAFKVKTTSPKKYCVRPTTGIIKPRSTCDFTVTMQAQKVAPPDLQCKDKFLVQGTVVPFGTVEEDITSDMFSKDSGKYVEETKLRVVLISPPHSPVLLPNNGELKKEQCYETSGHRDVALNGIENVPPSQKLPEDVLGSEAAKDIDECRVAKDAESRPSDDAAELKLAKDGLEIKLVKDCEDLKSKLQEMESKLKEADHTILELTEEMRLASREKDVLALELKELRRKNNIRRTRVGFPLLYVCMVALISLAFGYFIHS